jgi:hypothetical protein
MSNVLSEEKKQQVIALGKLGWSLRRIEEATGVRRETASGYLKATGVVVCLPRVGAPRAGKTGHTGDHRLLCGFFAKFGATQEPQVIAQHLRAPS